MQKGQRRRANRSNELGVKPLRVAAAAEEVSVLYYSDVHGGAGHDQNAVERLLDHIDSEPFDHIIDGGDRIDAYSVSKYDKNPTRFGELKDDLAWSKHHSNEVEKRNKSGAVLHFLKGNHEQRVPDYVRRKAPGLDGLSELSLPALLGVEHWKYHERPGVVINGVRFKHGDKVAKGAGNSVRKEMEDYWQSVVMGHCHRQAVVRVQKNSEFVGVEAGCLCSLTPEYLTNPDWKQGWVVVKIGPDGIRVEEHNP